MSGTTGSRHSAAANMQPDRYQPPENQTPDPISPETLGQCPRPCGAAGCGARPWRSFPFQVTAYLVTLANYRAAT